MINENFFIERGMHKINEKKNIFKKILNIFRCKKKNINLISFRIDT